MKRNSDYTGEVAQKSIKQALDLIQMYYDKYWSVGNECKVIEYTTNVVREEADKYLNETKFNELKSPLMSNLSNPIKFDKYYKKYEEKYGTSIMTLVMEYVNAMELAEKYDVGERKEEVVNDMARYFYPF